MLQGTGGFVSLLVRSDVIHAGGPGSSSAPTSLRKAEHPRSGWVRTRAALGVVQRAADPWAVIPSKRVQCQQGRSGASGEK